MYIVNVNFVNFRRDFLGNGSSESLEIFCAKSPHGGLFVQKISSDSEFPFLSYGFLFIFRLGQNSSKFPDSQTPGASKVRKIAETLKNRNSTMGTQNDLKFFVQTVPMVNSLHENFQVIPSFHFRATIFESLGNFG